MSEHTVSQGDIHVHGTPWYMLLSRRHLSCSWTIRIDDTLQYTRLCALPLPPTQDTLSLKLSFVIKFSSFSMLF